jgi:probable HAF family extracellular repeat protein
LPNLTRAENVTYGFTLRDGIYNFISYPRANQVGTLAFGINDRGQVVGFAQRVGGYVYSNGTFTFLPPAPGPFPASGLGPRSINNAGEIVGSYFGGDRVHGFIDVNGVVTTLDVPGSIQTQVTGINNAGQIVGAYVDGGGHGFLCSGGVFTTIDFPGALDTQLSGIDDSGEIVGTFELLIGTNGSFI